METNDMTKTLLMCGIAISAIALAITPAEAKKQRHHKAVDSQAAQTRELNLASLQQAQQNAAARQTAQQTTAGAAAQTAQSNQPYGSEPNEAAPREEDEDQQADNSKLPDLQGANDEVKADQANRSAAMQTPATTGAPGRTIALGDVANPKQTLAKAAIETKDGQKIGEVARVETDANGKASAVMMTAQGGGSTRLDASKLSFMPDRGVLVSEMTPATPNRQTPATPTPAPTEQTAPETQTVPDRPTTPETPPTAPPPAQ
jgi:hypothetical protein